MTSLEAGRWSELERLFHGALDRPPAECAAFLDAACGSDQALRAELECLLAADAVAESGISRIVSAGAASAVRELESASPPVARPTSTLRSP